MKKSMILLLLICFTQLTYGQYDYTTLNQTYTQDFESFAGTLASVPLNWTNSFNDYNPGGFYSNTGSYSNSLSTYALNQDGGSEYAIGSKIAASGGVQTLKFNARNKVSGYYITDFSVSWDAEQYSTGGRATTSDFSFSAGGTISGTTLTTATTGADANLGSVIVTPRSVTISGLNIKSDVSFDFVWTIATGAGSGNNAHIGIDNVSIQLTGTVLPIELTSFKAKLIDKSVLLSFSTATEIENDFFAIERSGNGFDFDEIGQVKGSGTSYLPLDYSFADEHPLPGKNYYRLRQVDFDGTYTNSPVVTATFGKASQITLAPMPATETLNIQLEKETQFDGQYEIFDLNGRLLLTGEVLAETLEQSIRIAELPEGAYVLRLIIGQENLVEQFWKK